MEEDRHIRGPRFQIEGSFAIPQSFQGPEIPPLGCLSQRIDCTQGGLAQVPFPNSDDNGFLGSSFQYDTDLMASSEVDPLENSAPSSPARSPPADGKEQHPCLKPGCNKIFTHLHKLQRHYRDAHGKPQYDCPYPNCVRKGSKGFARKDNMRQHHRLVHNKHLDPGEIPRRKRGSSA